MKKIITFISILIAAITLSSCVYVGSDTPVVIVPPTYSLTFNNQTSFDVADWYVQKTAGKKFYVDPNNTTPVWSHEKSTIYGLYTGWYKIRFTVDTSCAANTYYETEEVWLNENYEYKLYQRIIISRSANAEESETKEFVLVGQDGTEIPLTLCSE